MPAQKSPVQPEARVVAKPLDLSTVQIRTRNMTGPKVVVRWNTQIGEFTVLASRMLLDVSAESGEGPVRASHLAPWAVADENAPESEVLGDIAVVPVREKSLSTLGVKWYAKSKVRVDLAKLFSARRFVVPQGQAAHIPVSMEEVPGLGKAMILHFTQAWYAEVESSATRGKGREPKAEGA